MQVSGRLASSKHHLSSSCARMSSLLPLARQGAFLYHILCRQLGGSPSHGLQNWQHFTNLYSKALSPYSEMVAKIQSGGEGMATLLQDIVQHLNQTVLQDAFRYVNSYMG